MDERKKRVLQAIVLDYIATAEPVGSRTIARKFDLGVSPATIRNEMADLEDMGLIEQPHTSAGRIPSNSGYRFYVDCLMTMASLTDKEKLFIEKNVVHKIRELESFVQQTSRLVSQLTNLTALVLTPVKANSPFHQVHLLPYQPSKALMVVVKENGAVENHVIDIGENTTQEDLQRVSTILNSKLKGLTMEKVKSGLLSEIYSELARQKDLITMAMELLEPILGPHDQEKVVLGGTLNMLNQPEFKDVEKLKNVLRIFEEDHTLKKMLSPSLEPGLTVRIGGENNLEEIQDCSLITATYQINGQTISSVGVLGPTRMDYSKACSVVEFMTTSLGEVLKRYYN
jgi:heat-inducible transcriptional repressor